MVGLYLRTSRQSELRWALDTLSSVPGLKGTERSSFRLYSPTGEFSDKAGLGLDARSYRSMFFPPAPGTICTVAISPAQTYFRNAWAVALLSRLNEALVPKGLLVVPASTGKKAAKSGHWSAEWLRGHLGEPVWQKRDGTYLAFEKSSSVKTPASVLTWFFSDRRGLRDDLYRVARCGLDETWRASTEKVLLAPSQWRTLATSEDGCEKCKTDAGAGFDGEAWNYSLFGANYKSALMEYILGTFLGERKDLTLLDMGGGSGLLAAELLLAGKRLGQAVNCDIKASSMVPARRLHKYYADEISGRLHVHIGSAQAFEFDALYDAVSFIGSLLYVPREHTQGLLDRAWQGLRPGGVLVVHENIKAPSYTRDYNRMFERDELDGYLKRYARIHRFLATGSMSVGKLRAGSKTVFRVVQKPGCSKRRERRIDVILRGRCRFARPFFSYADSS